MKIVVKHNLVIFKNPAEWESISAKLIRTHGASIMISWKMKRELGFTVRRHRGLAARDGEVNKQLTGRFYYEDWICLDFYSESALTYFLLKYIHD